MFKTAIVASDLSPASDRVISCLHGLKPMGTERDILTHALGIHHLEEMKHLLAPSVGGNPRPVRGGRCREDLEPSAESSGPQ